MRNPTKALFAAAALAVALAAAPALYAHESKESGGSMMGPGMMGQGGMMNMMGQMGEMMEGCSKMMQSMNHDGSDRPNEQWREDAPDGKRTPGTNG